MKHLNYESSNQLKDPAELSIAERKALFEKNSGTHLQNFSINFLPEKSKKISKENQIIDKNHQVNDKDTESNKDCTYTSQLSSEKPVSKEENNAFFPKKRNYIGEIQNCSNQQKLIKNDNNSVNSNKLNSLESPPDNLNLNVNRMEEESKFTERCTNDNNDVNERLYPNLSEFMESNENDVQSETPTYSVTASNEK